MEQVPKRITRALRELAAEAYEEELRRSLLPLRDAFGRWDRGELPSRDLSDRIHQFHRGPAREVWVKYNSGMPDAAVAFAIVAGLVDRSKVAPEVLEHLSRAIRFYESDQ